MLSIQETQAILKNADLIVDEKTIHEAIKHLAKNITIEMKNSYPLVLTVMGGSLVFAGQLLPQLLFPLNFNYIHATRYGAQTSGGELIWRQAPQEEVKDRNILVLDDILDEGYTMQAIHDKTMALGAKTFKCAVLANKLIKQPKPIKADFVGLDIPDRFVFGFGIDIKGLWRNLPAIYATK